MSITDYEEFDIVNTMLNFLYANIKAIESTPGLDSNRKMELVVDAQRECAKSIVKALEKKALVSYRTN